MPSFPPSITPGQSRVPSGATPHHWAVGSRRGVWREAWAIVLPLVVFMVTTGPAGIPAGQAAQPLPAIALLRSDRPLVIGHRGRSAVAPENTLTSFRLAMDAGADLVELDYHHTRDGVPIVIHDGTLDRTTDATNRWGGRDLRVADYSLEQLRPLSAGQWRSPAFAGETLPTLEEALSVIQARGVTLIERKGGDAFTCVQLLRAKQLLNRVVVQSFDWNYLRDYHRSEPDQVLGALGPPGSRDGRTLTDPEKALGTEWLDQIQALGARVAVWNRQVDAESVRAAHARGLRVWVYTINEPDLARSLVASGVTGIITDDPQRIQSALSLPARP